MGLAFDALRGEQLLEAAGTGDKDYGLQQLRKRAIHFTLAGEVSWAWRAISVDSCLLPHHSGSVEAKEPRHGYPDESEVDSAFAQKGVSTLLS